jgi:thioredoxin-related protein
MRALALSVSMLLAAPALAQAPSPHAIETPPWFSETLLEFPEEIRDAAREGKRLLLYFGQDGCPYCKTLLQTNFTQKALVDKTRRHFVAIALNVWGDRELVWTDGRRMSEKALARTLRVQFTPTLLFLDENGAPVARLNGYYPPQRLAAALDYASGTAGKGQRFDEYMRTAAKESASPVLHAQPFILKPPLRLDGAKPVALLFETAFCSGCDELHNEGFKRADVLRLLQRFDVYRVGMDEKRAQTLRISYTPSIVLFDRGAEVLRIEAYVRPFHLASALDYVASGAYRRETSFQRYIQSRAERLRVRGERVELW